VRDRKLIPLNSHIRLKAEKVKALKEAVERYRVAQEEGELLESDIPASFVEDALL
jgi:hypothetical protein